VITSLIACLAIGYLCGSLPWGLWLGRWFRGVDVRTLGSGNLGATNVFRTLGRGLGLLTMTLDILKGTLPVLIVPALPIAAQFPGGREWCAITVGAGAVMGHMWTFLAGFRGGKGVAVTGGALLGLSLFASAIGIGVFVLTVAITRYISLGSIVGSLAFAVALVWRSGGRLTPLAVFGCLAALLIIVRHRDNIGRLLRGQERRFSWSARS
jgi:acyl phosphate:glycerol-3-phosphate acyltransferase